MTAGTSKEKNNIRERFAPAFVSRFIAERKKASWQRFREKIRITTSVAQINDCGDGPARLQLEARASEILGRNSGFQEVSNDLEAAGGIVSALHAFNDASDVKTRAHKNVILANVAPRTGSGNGSPFCYFWKDGTLVVTTVEGLALSLVNKLGITDRVYEMDTIETLRTLRQSGVITEEYEKDTAETQFRSLEFSSTVATYLLREGSIKGARRKSIEGIQAPPAIWHVDVFSEFGNCKTTLLPEDVFPPDIALKLKSGNGDGSQAKICSLDTKFGSLPVYRRLKDVPLNELAVIVGSTGFKEQKFLEIVVGHGSAAKRLEEISHEKISSGTLVL